MKRDGSRSTCLFSTMAAGALSDTLGSKRTLIAGQAAYFTGALRILASLRFLPTFCYGLMVVFVPLQLRAADAVALFFAVAFFKRTRAAT